MFFFIGYILASCNEVVSVTNSQLNRWTNEELRGRRITINVIIAATSEQYFALSKTWQFCYYYYYIYAVLCFSFIIFDVINCFGIVKSTTTLIYSLTFCFGLRTVFNMYKYADDRFIHFSKFSCIQPSICWLAVQSVTRTARSTRTWPGLRWKTLIDRIALTIVAYRAAVLRRHTIPTGYWSA